MNTNETTVSKEEVTQAHEEDALITEDARQELAALQDSLEFQPQKVVISEEILAMTPAQLEEAQAREEAAIRDLQAQRTALEPSFRALTRKALLQRGRKQMAECARTMEESHALSEQMNALRAQELEHQNTLDQLLARKEEL